MFYSSRYSSSHLEGGPDYVKLAEAYGVVGLRATKPSEVEGVLKEAFQINKPVLMDFQVDQYENCYPMVPAGGAIHQMILEDPKPDQKSEQRQDEKNKESILPA
jgi:acetolactate synthase I/II/III large subunit